MRRAQCRDAVPVQCIQIRRPNNYDINVSLMLGPTEPDPTMDVSSLDIVKTVVQDSPHKLFIGGLPCDWTEDQVCGRVPSSGGDFNHAISRFCLMVVRPICTLVLTADCASSMQCIVHGNAALSGFCHEHAWCAGEGAAAAFWESEGLQSGHGQEHWQLKGQSSEARVICVV